MREREIRQCDGNLVEVTDNHHRAVWGSTIIETCKGPIILNRIDTIKKNDWDSWSIVFNRFFLQVLSWKYCRHSLANESER